MKHTTEVMISAEEINEKLDILAERINAHYADSERLLMVGLLKGSVVFMADLCRRIKGHVEIDFMSVSSYGNAMTSTRDVKILKDVSSEIAGRDVLIVEDLIDSGNTLNKVREMLLLREPKSLALCTLLDKPERREVNVPVDFIGFTIPDEFIVGYGIDYAEQYRNLPYIARVVPLD